MEDESTISNNGLTATSVNEALLLLNNVERKKKYFEETISKLMSFKPEAISPSQNKRQSPRLNVSTPSQLSGQDINLVGQQINFLLDINMKLIPIVYDLQNNFEELESKTKGIP